MDGKDKDAAKEKIAKIERQLPYSEELFAKNLTSRLYKGVSFKTGTAKVKVNLLKEAFCRKNDQRNFRSGVLLLRCTC